MTAHAAPATLRSPQPDVTLVLDMDGTIQEASLSGSVPEQDLGAWIGRPWVETVVDPGSAKVRRIVDDARTTGVSAFRQINQRFPNGLELPIEYTAIRQGPEQLVAVGKSLQAVAEMQSRLMAAQQAIERDHWKLREIETRCRLLFDRSNEAVLLVRASNLRILEANPSALRALETAATAPERGSGRELTAFIAPDDRSSFEAMLHRVRDQGKAPGVLIHLGDERAPWLVRASLLPSQEGLAYLLQLTPAVPSPHLEEGRVPVEPLIERSPDGFVAIDAKGSVLRANRAFLDMIQVGDETPVVGEPLGRWLGLPGADVPLLLAHVVRHGAVRLFSTTLHGELGTSTEVEVAAAGDRDLDPSVLGVLVRDVASRLPTTRASSQLGSILGAFTDRIGRTPLPVLVKEAVGVLERHYIHAALEQTGGNRTAAAQLLGVSRQSLYAKLNRYGSESPDPIPSQTE